MIKGITLKRHEEPFRVVSANTCSLRKRVDSRRRRVALSYGSLYGTLASDCHLALYYGSQYDLARTSYSYDSYLKLERCSSTGI